MKIFDKKIFPLSKNLFAENSLVNITLPHIFISKYSFFKFIE